MCGRQVKCNDSLIMPSLNRYFQNQIQEIQNDVVLRIYGMCLALAQVLSFSHWYDYKVMDFLHKGAEPVCWPFFENCFDFRFFTLDQIRFIFWIYCLSSVAAVLLFIPRRWCAAAYGWLIVVNFLKTIIYIQDFRLRLNQHYMLYFATIAFLFFPHKRNLLRYLLVFFYIWAGKLKLNTEWLSGAALYHDPLWIHGQWIPAACFYTLILELFISIGILVPTPWIYWSSFFQLCLFHFISFPVVKTFYPLLMYLLLTIFPLTYFSRRSDEPNNLLRSLVSFKQPLSVYLFLGFFSVLQLIPVVMPGDERITGEGRLFSLHMFDSLQVCKGELTLKLRGGVTRKMEIPRKDIPMKYGNRIKCDPVVSLSMANYQCRQNRNNPDFLDLDLYYESRLSSGSTMRPLVNVKDFCRQHLTYRLFQTNDWIEKNQ